MGITAKVAALRVERSGGKAISHKPELEGRVHVVSQYANEAVQELGVYADYARVYEVYAWVHKAIRKTAEAISPLSVRVVDQDGEAVQGHPLTELLSYVNDTMNPAELWQRWVVHMYLAGESFFEVVDGRGGQPVELWPRRPDEVRVVPDVAAERRYYPRVAGYLWGNDDLAIEPESMVHARFYNPLNAWRGLAPIAAVREGVTIDLFSQAWSKLFLKRGARPDYALVAPQGITRSEREEIERTLAFKFSGSDNWHKPIVLEEGVTDIKTFSFAPKDMEWLEQRKFSRDEVAAIFGVPDEIMGYGRDTYENFDTALKVFWTLTLVPLMGHRDTSLTHHFSKVRPLLKPGQRVETDLAGVGVLQEDLAPKAELATQLFGLGVPFNTIDERLQLGIGPIPGGDVGWLPFSLMAVGGGTTDGTTDNSPTGEEPGDERGIRYPVSGIGERRALPEPVVKVAAYGSPEHVARWKAFETKRAPYERRMVRMLKRTFQRQQDEALASLKDEEKSKAIAVQMKRESVVIDPLELVNWPEELKRMIEEYTPHYEDVVAAFGTTELEALAVGISFDLRNPIVMDVIREMVIRFANDINAGTQAKMIDALRPLLAEAEEQGLSIREIQERIYDEISTVFNVRKAPYETERIARTEMIGASNGGALEGMRQSGVVKKKGWLSAMDERVRTPPDSVFDHIAAHGEEVPLEAMFQRTGEPMERPGDKNGSLANFINCRCTVYAVV